MAIPYGPFSGLLRKSGGTITVHFSNGAPAEATTPDELPPMLVLPVTKQTGGILGFRAWRLMTDGSGPILQSSYMDTLWLGPTFVDAKPPENGRASGWFDYMVQHGIYAAKSFKPLDYDDASVYGEVLLWGRVIIHEDGYRAQKAMIRRLVVVDHFALLANPLLPQQLAARYDCTVDTDIRTLLTPEA